MSILGALALGLGSGVASAGVGALANSALARQQQEYYEKNQRTNFGYQMQAQKNAPSNAVEGMRLAGLSPALASEGKFSSAGAPTSPLGSSAVSMADVNFANSSLALAEARKANAEAKGQENVNESYRDEKETINELLEKYYKNMADQEKDPQMKKYYLERSQLIGSQGALQGLQKFIEMSDKAEILDLHRFEYRVSKAVAEAQYRTYLGKPENDVILALANQPIRDRQKDYKFLAEMTERINNLRKEGKILDQDLQLTEAEIKQLEAVAEHVKNSDINSLIKSGDYTGALIATLTLVLEAIAGGSGRMIPSVSHSTAHVTTSKQ